MKKKILAVILALAMLFSMPAVAFAADTSKTEALLKDISKTGKLSATVTSFHSDEWQFTNYIRFDIYDDFNENKIRVDFKNSPFNVIYADKKLNIVIPGIISYFPISTTDVDIVNALVNSFQKLFKTFVDNPTLSAFKMTASKETRNGKTVTKEYFKGKTIGTSGTFYYGEDGKICEIVLSNNADVSISMTLENYSSSFEKKVFDIPLYYFNLTIIAKLLIMIITALGLI